MSREFRERRKAAHMAGLSLPTDRPIRPPEPKPELTAAEKEYQEIMDIFYAAEKQYRRDARDEFENCGPADNLAAKANRRLAEWRAKYPRERALKIAEHWGDAANYAKVAAGNRAAQRIKAGQDYKMVIAEMKAEFGAWCDEHVD